MCFTLRLPLTSLWPAAFFCVTPSPDRPTRYSILATLPTTLTTPLLLLPPPSNSISKSPSFPIHSPIAIPLPRRLPLPPLLLLRWIPGTLSIRIPFTFRSWNASVRIWNGSHSSSSSTFSYSAPHLTPLLLSPMLALSRFRHPDLSP